MASILAGAALAAGVAQAQGVSTERPGSILIFPKVVNAGADTIIQIANTSNSLTYAHCFYVNGDKVNGVPIWQVTDFELVLTRQQPTHWAASAGRAVNPMDNYPAGKSQSGLDPGLVPPVVPGFTGFLTCVETASDGTPVSSNSLIGTAVVGSTAADPFFSKSKYNAVAIPGCLNSRGPCGATGDANTGDNVLELNDVEYARCPGGLYLNFQSEGSSDPALDDAGNTPSAVSTNLALVPCGLDFENLEPTMTTIGVEIRDEFEHRTSLSSGIGVDCYFEGSLGDPPFSGTFALPTDFGSAILRPIPGTGLPPVLGVANVLRTAGDGTSDTAATNLHFCTDESAPASCTGVDTEIRLPTFQ
ncbi:MAG TPA: hypothetical protein VL049_01510 [Candidatus Dormibacteraeota bacterium]|nr:hypothetical protein [Candidatus Dormibacteraeota bacterium]